MSVTKLWSKEDDWDEEMAKRRECVENSFIPSNNTWASAEIDDLQDTVEDLEADLEKTKHQRDSYHNLMDDWHRKFDELNRRFHDKIEAENLVIRDKSMIYLDLIEEYDNQFRKAYLIKPGLLSNVKIKHLRQKGEIDL